MFVPAFQLALLLTTGDAIL